MPPTHLLVTDWLAAREHAQFVRYAVFVVEQSVPVEIEWDEHDATSWHVVAYDESGKPVGTGRLLPDGHIGRMAVMQPARGLGIGTAILTALTAKAQELGMTEVILHAQTAAIPFYVNSGFAAEGEQFMEAGIPHQLMRKSLRY